MSELDVLTALDCHIADVKTQVEERYSFGDEKVAGALETYIEQVRAVRKATAAALLLAERYRWLRDNCEQVADEEGRAAQLYFGTYGAGNLDVAIDLARGAKP